jgi:hypothetical protein
MMPVGRLVAVAVVAFGVGAVVAAPGALAQSRFNEKITAILRKLDAELGKYTQFERESINDLDRYQAQLTDLRNRITSNPSLRTTKSAGYLILAVDILELGRQSVRADALLNQTALQILANVTRGLLASGGYLGLDQQLLILEKSEPQRDANIRKIQPHFDRLDLLFSLAENTPDSGGLADMIKTGRGVLALLRLAQNQVVGDYDDVLKPGTKMLRSFVDMLAKQ